VIGYEIFLKYCK